jgi:hypothetical protein
MIAASLKQIALVMNVSERNIRYCIELQRCNRPDIEQRLLSGEISVAEALRMAKPEKYAKPDKVGKWLAAFRSWSGEDQEKAILALADVLEARQ